MSDAAQLRWPPERFFWAVLRMPAWRRVGSLPWGLLADAADEFPLPIEDLHAVGAPAGEGRVVVCAARRDELATIDPRVASLTPEHLPDCIEAGVDPEVLELLVGDFEPPEQRRARFRRHAALSATVFICATLIAIGVGRRTEHWTDVAAAARAARLELTARVAPGIAPEHLAMEVAQMRSAAETAGVRPPRDAALTLASLLDAWPQATSATPQSIAVSDSNVSLSVSVEGEATAFLGALMVPEGWALEDPRLNASGGVTRLTLQMRPTESSP